MTFVQAIPEAKRIEGRRLGRHVHHDDRSKGFPAAESPTIIDIAHRVHRLPLRQTRGSCTAEATCGALDSAPDYHGIIYNQKAADHLYDEEIVNEGGNPATDDPGGTGLMVCKTAQQLGWIKSYTHTFSLDSALKALVIRPVITGVNWYEGFDRPDGKGIVKIAGGIRGGHEFVGVQILLAERLVGFVQSWGRPWGVANKAVRLTTGAFFMTFDTWGQLLSERGDVTVPVP
jgi:hypothetical protein